jgi:exopolysaccharide biosynthesis polyprenyl glycosylphosphotransferase
VLIVGANRLGQELADELQGDYQVVGYVDNGSDLEPSDLPLLGPIAQLDELVQAHAIDELIVVLPATRREQINRILARGFRRHVRVKLLHELDEVLPTRFDVYELGGRRYVGFMPVAAVSSAKRVVDVVLVSLGLVVAAPVLAAIAIAIKLDSPGPAFHCQLRVGKDGRVFRIWKFRSMIEDAERLLDELRVLNEASGPLFKMRRDPRVTRVGAVLRRWSLDELPQLFNVLRGDMSLVGPRPLLMQYLQRYTPDQARRHEVRPGITGLAQVSGRNRLSWDEKFRLDVQYVDSCSFALDVRILASTLWQVVARRGINQPGHATAEEFMGTSPR